MKDAVARGKVEKLVWVDTKKMVTDVLVPRNQHQPTSSRGFWTKARSVTKKEEGKKNPGKIDIPIITGSDGHKTNPGTFPFIYMSIIMNS